MNHIIVDFLKKRQHEVSTIVLPQDVKGIGRQQEKAYQKGYLEALDHVFYFIKNLEEQNKE